MIQLPKSWNMKNEQLVGLAFLAVAALGCIVAVAVNRYTSAVALIVGINAAFGSFLTITSATTNDDNQLKTSGLVIGILAAAVMLFAGIWIGTYIG